VVAGKRDHREAEAEQGLTSHQTHYRGRVFTGQMTQPTVSKHWRKRERLQLGCWGEVGTISVFEGSAYKSLYSIPFYRIVKIPTGRGGLC